MTCLEAASRVVERVREAHSLQRGLRHAADRLRRLDAERVEHGRHHVDRVRVLGADLAARAHPVRPGEDERVGRAAAVGLALPAPERRVAGPRPAPRVVVVGRRPAEVVDVAEVVLEALRHHVEEAHLVERAADAALGGGAVVGDDHDQRVVELADLLERVEHAAEVVVAVGDEARVDLHHPRVQPALVGGQRRPLRHVGVARRQLGVGGQQPELLLAGEHGLAVGVPAAVELAGVAVGPFARGVVRRVRASGRVVHVERLLGRVDVRVEQEPDRLVGEVLAEVVAVLRALRLGDRPVVERQVRIPLVGLAAEEAVEALEAAAERPAVERAGGRCSPPPGRGATCRGRTCCTPRERASRGASRSRTACARRSPDSRSRAP